MTARRFLTIEVLCGDTFFARDHKVVGIQFLLCRGIFSAGGMLAMLIALGAGVAE